MAHVYSPRKGIDYPFREQRCAAAVHKHRYGVRQCSKPGRIEEEGYKWCGTHAPSAEARRHNKADAKFKNDILNSPAMKLTRAVSRIHDLERAIDLFLSNSPLAGVEYLRSVREEGYELVIS